MKRKNKSNSGFTLIELIIAMAMLAFVMIAVSSFMGSGVLGFKKAKADITVHNSAQQTYDQLTDSVIQANDIIIYGYTTVDPTDKVSFSQSGGEPDVGLNSQLTYFVRDDAQKAYVQSMSGFDASASFVKYSDLSKNTQIYVVKLITETATPFDPAYATSVGSDEYLNSFTNLGVKIEQETREESDGSVVAVQSVTGQKVYSINDTIRHIYTFDGENMYYETKYAFMTALDDCYKGSTDNWGNYIYSESFSYKDLPGGGTVSGCVATIDADNGAISFDLYFSDKNMTYTTKGMIKFRNSYVLKAKN